MNATGNVIVVILVLLATVTLGMVGMAALRHGEQQRSVDASVNLTERGIPVHVSTPTVRLVKVEVAARGFLEPFEQITVSTEVPGFIESQRVEVSDRVTAGDPLYELDPSLRTAAVERAKAELERARSDSKLAEVNRRRVETLEQKQSANPTEVLQVNTEYQKALALVKMAEAALCQAEIQLKKTQIVSPITGLVSQVHARRGEFAHAGQPLVDIIEVARLKLPSQLDDREVVVFATGDPVSITIAAFPAETFEGRILRIYPNAAPDSRRFEVEVEIPNPTGKLRPGFYAEAHFVGGDNGDIDATGAPKALVVPRSAIMEQYGAQYCFVVRGGKDNALERAYRTRVETVSLLSDPQNVQVTHGLTGVDRVITSGLQQIDDKSVVRVTN